MKVPKCHKIYLTAITEEHVMVEEVTCINFNQAQSGRLSSRNDRKNRHQREKQNKNKKICVIKSTVKTSLEEIFTCLVVSEA